MQGIVLIAILSIMFFTFVINSFDWSLYLLQAEVAVIDKYVQDTDAHHQDLHSNDLADFKIGVLE